jgi:hypothetical protein
MADKLWRQIADQMMTEKSWGGLNLDILNSRPFQLLCKEVECMQAEIESMQTEVELEKEVDALRE